MSVHVLMNHIFIIFVTKQKPHTPSFLQMMRETSMEQDEEKKNTEYGKGKMSNWHFERDVRLFHRIFLVRLLNEPKCNRYTLKL